MQKRKAMRKGCAISLLQALWQCGIYGTRKLQYRVVDDDCFQQSPGANDSSMPPTLLNSRNSLIRRLEEPFTATHLPLFLYVQHNKEEEEEEEEQEIAGAIRPPVEHKISYCSPFYHLLMEHQQRRHSTP
jgi:hypothetical protein